ncbi:MAG: hypothetical protein GY835_22170 [bacterium]|nr:hypothetical protein [bacterium]
MAKFLFTWGVFVTLLMTGAMLTGWLGVHGEEDWNLGIAVVICLLSSGILGTFGAIIGCVVLLRSRQRRSLVVTGLLLNLLPASVVLYFLVRQAAA